MRIQISTINNYGRTLSKDGRQTVLQQVSSHRSPLISFDISTAFLHGKGDGRNLGIHPPAEIKEAVSMSDTDQRALNGGAYGRIDAPYLWFCELRDELLNQGYKRCPLDPCVFYKRKDWTRWQVPAAGMSIDSCGRRHRWRLPWISGDAQTGGETIQIWQSGEFKYTGIHFKQWDDGSIEYDQKGYIEKLEPILSSKDRKGKPR